MVCNKQNKLWLEHFELKGMMLHAHQLIFDHITITSILNARLMKSLAE
jgi:tRNA pseudouridine65 synthase